MQTEQPGARDQLDALGEPDEEVSHARAMGRQGAYIAKLSSVGVLVFVTMAVLCGIVVWFVFPATVGLGAWGTAIRYSLMAIAAVLPALFLFRWIRRNPAPTFPQSSIAMLGYVRPPNISRMCAISVLAAAMMGVEIGRSPVGMVPAVGGLPPWSMIFVTALAFLTVPGVGSVLAWARAHGDDFDDHDDDDARAVERSHTILVVYLWLVAIGAATGIAWTVVILQPVLTQLGVVGFLAAMFNTTLGFLFMPVFLAVMGLRMIRRWQGTALGAK